MDGRLIFSICARRTNKNMLNRKACWNKKHKNG